MQDAMKRETIIKFSDFFLVANLNVRIYINDETIHQLENIGLKIERLAKSYDKFHQKIPILSQLFTLHMKEEHFPVCILLDPERSSAKIDLDRLRKLDSKFKNLKLDEEIVLSWRNFLTSNGMGTFIIEFHTRKPLPSSIHNKLSLIYLKYDIVPTKGLKHLFQHDYFEKDDSNQKFDDFGVDAVEKEIKIFKKWTKPIPKYISIEEICKRFEIELIYKIKTKLYDKWSRVEKNMNTVLPNPNWKRFRSLGVETITPIINIGMEKDGLSQREWIEKNKRLIANYAFRPRLFEIQQLSDIYIDKKVSEDSIWSISEDNFCTGNYHGLVRVTFSDVEYGCEPENYMSGFWMDNLFSFLYTVLIPIQNYYSLRIFDNYLDRITEELFIRGSSSAKKKKSTLQVLQIIQEVTHKIDHQLEELDNVDKLIDSDPHIELVKIIIDFFDLQTWHRMVKNKLKSIEKYSESLDYVHEWMELEDNTIIDRSQVFLIANLYLRIYINEKTAKLLEDSGLIIEPLADKHEDNEFSPLLAELFTIHFKRDHFPINIFIQDPETGDKARDWVEIDIEELKRQAKKKGSSFFDDLKMDERLILRWRNLITNNGMGTLIFEFETTKPLHQKIHRKLSLIYLKWKIIPTKGLEFLFKHGYKKIKTQSKIKYYFESDYIKGDDVFIEDQILDTGEKKIPKYVSINELCERFEIELVYILKRKIVDISPAEECNEILLLPNPFWERFKSLSIDTITPINVLHIQKAKDFTGQTEWIEQHRKLVGNYVAKPELFEMGELSEHYIRELTENNKIWSISEDSFVVGSYHGLVRITFSEKKQETSLKDEFAGFWMDTTNTFLYSTLISIQNYYTLRIFDRYLDMITDELFAIKQKEIKDTLTILERIQEVIHKVQNQLEEVDNVDKLIDSEPHIELVNKINRIFELENWMDMVVKKIGSIDRYAQMLDYVNDNRSKKKMERLLIIIAVAEFIFGMLEIIFFFISI